MLHVLSSIVEKSDRRLGQGHGSGRVKTSGRGTKGQKARRKIGRTFEGGALSLIKRLPFRRGKGRNKGLSIKSFGIPVERLNELPAKTVVTEKLLIEKKIVDAATMKRHGVKILSGGKLTNALTIKVPVSKSAAVIIEKAGGNIERA